MDRAVDELTKRGVRFEHYNEGDLKTDEKRAYAPERSDDCLVKDPAGNILSAREA